MDRKMLDTAMAACADGTANVLGLLAQAGATPLLTFTIVAWPKGKPQEGVFISEETITIDELREALVYALGKLDTEKKEIEQ